jgi:hypothetical protein
MDQYDKFLESLSLDPDGLGKQFMSLSSFVNILIASVMGFLVLAVYLASSGREKRDKNLYMVIPVLSVLMAVMMRIDGPQAISFLGVFGILSIIRFRSDITDQKGITFILFAVIEGVIVGVNAYLLALLAWGVVSGAILIGRYLFGHRASYRLVLRYPRELQDSARSEACSWFETKGIKTTFTGFNVSTEYSEKSKSWDERYKAEFILFPKEEAALLAMVYEFLDEMQNRGIEAELRRQEAG